MDFFTDLHNPRAVLILGEHEETPLILELREDLGLEGGTGHDYALLHDPAPGGITRQPREMFGHAVHEHLHTAPLDDLHQILHHEGDLGMLHHTHRIYHQLLRNKVLQVFKKLEF